MMFLRRVLILLLPVFASGCGQSLYKSLSTNTSADAKLEDILIALDHRDYPKALSLTEPRWSDEHSNENAQLYAVSILGVAGLDLFNLIRDSFAKVSSSSDRQSVPQSSKKSSTGNDIMSNLKSVLPVSVINANLDQILKAVQVLAEAPDQKDSGLFFQKCITGAIYALPVLDNLQTSIADFQIFLQALPGKLGTTSAGGACTATSSSVAELGDQLTALIDNASQTSSKIHEIVALVGDCLGDSAKSAESSANTVQTQISTLTSASDKGCESINSIGGISLPSCMSSYLTSASQGVVAGDGKLAGCEVMIHCSGGTCFK